MILLSPSPRRGALPFLIGSLAGSIVVVGLAAVGLQFLPVKPPRLRKDEWVAQFAIVIGALLVVYAVYLLVSKGGRDNAGANEVAVPLGPALGIRRFGPGL